MIERRITQDSPALHPLSAFLTFRRTHHDANSFPDAVKNKVTLEMGATGLMMIGLLGSLRAKEVVIRPIDPRLHQAPDCEVIDLVTEHILHQVEVVHFTGYSHQDGILKFLLKTKLNPKYAYPSEVAILCHYLGVQKNLNWQKLHQKIQAVCPTRKLFILVRTDRLTMNYELVKIAPTLERYQIVLPSGN